MPFGSAEGREGIPLRSSQAYFLRPGLRRYGRYHRHLGKKLEPSSFLCSFQGRSSGSDSNRLQISPESTLRAPSALNPLGYDQVRAMPPPMTSVHPKLDMDEVEMGGCSRKVSELPGLPILPGDGRLDMLTIGAPPRFTLCRNDSGEPFFE